MRVSVSSKFYFVLYDIAVLKNNAMKLSIEIGLINTKDMLHMFQNKYCIHPFHDTSRGCALRACLEHSFFIGILEDFIPLERKPVTAFGT